MVPDPQSSHVLVPDPKSSHIVVPDPKSSHVLVPDPKSSHVLVPDPLGIALKGGGRVDKNALEGGVLGQLMHSNPRVH